MKNKFKKRIYYSNGNLTPTPFEADPSITLSKPTGTNPVEFAELQGYSNAVDIHSCP